MVLHLIINSCGMCSNFPVRPSDNRCHLIWLNFAFRIPTWAASCLIWGECFYCIRFPALGPWLLAPHCPQSWSQRIPRLKILGPDVLCCCARDLTSHFQNGLTTRGPCELTPAFLFCLTSHFSTSYESDHHQSIHPSPVSGLPRLKLTPLFLILGMLPP